MPASLALFTDSAALIGILMGLDNVLGIFLQPLMGLFSDNLRTKFGRRLPFLIVGVPLAAMLFILIPFTDSLASLVIVILLFAITANSFKGITLSLTPDFQPPGRRSIANSLVQVAGSVAVVVSAVVSLLVADKDLRLAFFIPALLMIVATLVVVLTLKETKSPGYIETQKASVATGRVRVSYGVVMKGLFQDRDRSRLAILAVTVVASAAWAAVRAQLTPYAMDQLGLRRGEAGALVLPAGLGFLIVALPIAMLSDRFGRRFITKLGLLGFVAGCIIAFAVPSLPGTITGVIISSIGFAAFAVNGVVILWNLAPSSSVMGMYTGIFAVFYAIGSSLGPSFIGVLTDITSWRYFMLFAAGLGLLAFVLLFTVRSETLRTTPGT